MSHKDISRNFLLQYKLTGSEAEQAHATAQLHNYLIDAIHARLGT
jgi:hypothetical protein